VAAVTDAADGRGVADVLGAPDALAATLGPPAVDDGPGCADASKSAEAAAPAGASEAAVVPVGPVGPLTAGARGSTEPAAVDIATATSGSIIAAAHRWQ
jgi:hypothetical protein